MMACRLIVQRVAVAAMVFLGSIEQATAAVISINSIADATLEAGNANRNRGNDILVVGNSGGAGRRHSLLLFDDIATLIGAGFQINSATLSLRINETVSPATAEQIGVFSVTRPWTEGIGTGSSGNTPFGATWNSALREGNDGIGEGEPGDGDGPVQWTNAGGDFFGTTGVQATNPFATGAVDGNNYTFNVTNLVTAWYDGTIANHGLALTPLTADAMIFSRVSYRTSDEAMPGGTGSFPRLEIDYTVPEPAACLLLATAAVVCGRRRPRWPHFARA
jgi:hypothetical protein